MKFFFLSLASIFIMNPMWGQSPVPAFEWANHLAAPGGTIVQNDLKVDSENNIYITGRLSPETSVSFSSGTGSQSLSAPTFNGATYCAKYDEDWNLIWAKSSEIGGMEARSLSIDNDDNIIINGRFFGNTDFMLGNFDTGDSLIEADGYESFLAKYNTDCDLLWVYHTEGTSNIQPQHVETDSIGNIYQFGNFFGTVDFNPSGNGDSLVNGNSSYSDKYLLKLDGDGNFLWSKHFPVNTPAGFNTRQMKVDPTGQYVYLAGTLAGPNDFDPNPDSEAIPETDGDDVFIAKYTNEGDFVWVKTIESTDYIFLQDFDIQSNGNLVLLGNFKEISDFDPSAEEFLLTSTNVRDQFLAHYTDDGNLIYAYAIHNESYNMSSTPFSIRGLEIGNDDAIYIEGYLSGYADFDLGEGVQEFTTSDDGFNLRRHFYAKYNESFNIQWFTLLTENEYTDDIDIRGFAIDSEHSLLSAAKFTGSLFFPDYTFQESWISYNGDVSLMKFKQCDYIIDMDVNDCEDHVWNAETYTESGEYTQSFVSSLGCDSIVTKNLTLYNPSSSDTTLSACGSYTWEASGEEYDVSGTYTTTLTNVNGCDSLMTLNLSLENETATQSETSCGPFYWSSSDSTYEESGNYDIVFDNAAGCDSVIILDLEIFEDVEHNVENTACDEYFWPTSNTTYTNSGEYSETLTTINSCDSVVILNLSILESTVDTIYEESCSKYTWPVNGNTYSSPGVYEFVTENSVGCDSIIRLELSILSSDISEGVTSCDSFVWPVDGNTYEESGVYYASFTNEFGCDSVHELDLDIIEIDTSVTVNGASLEVQNEIGEVQWLDCDNEFAEIPGANEYIFNPSENGSYAVTISANGCQDTSACYLISTVGLESYDFGVHGLSVYPNPTSGHILVESTLYPLSTLRIECYDLLGKRIELSESTKSNGFYIPGSPGIYILRAKIEGQSAVNFKVVKQ